MFPQVDPDALKDLIRALCYSAHGGSGFSFTRADVLDMGLGEAMEHAEWLDEQRTREANAMRHARK